MKPNCRTRKLTTMAMLAAVSIALVYLIRFPLFLPFLEYDPADIPILIATFAYGPLSGLLMTVVVSVIQGMTVSASSGIIGISMHIFATGGFVLVAGNIYKSKKTKKRALAGLVAGALTMVVSMIAWNLIFTPIFTGMPVEAVAKLLAPAIIPFNLVKAGINATVTFLLYKPVAPYLGGRSEECRIPAPLED